MLRKACAHWRSVVPLASPAATAMCMARRLARSGFDSDASVPTPPPLTRKPTLDQPHTGTADGRGGVVIGDATVGVRDNLPYITRRSHFVGRMLPLVRPRTDAGDVLALIDLCAASAATAFMNEETELAGRFQPTNGVTMATISFNSFTFPSAVYEGDLVLLESRVIHTGSTSIGVHSTIERQAFDSPRPSYIGEAYVTFVMISSHDLATPARGLIPAVRLSTPEDVVRNAMLGLMRRQSVAAHAKTRVPSDGGAEAPALRVADIELPQNRQKSRHVGIRESTVVVHHSFGVADVNVNKVIFGGAILRFMEKSALFCGRVFAGHERLFTLAMLGMTFDHPMLLRDLARCRARVLCVRGSTLLVRVEITAQSSGRRLVTNTADFILVAVTEDGKPMEIDCGLDLSKASAEELRWYLRARTLMEDSERNRHHQVGRCSAEEAEAKVASLTSNRGEQ